MRFVKIDDPVEITDPDLSQHGQHGKVTAYYPGLQCWGIRTNGVTKILREDQFVVVGEEEG